MQVLLQARAVLWIAVVTSSGDERYLLESKRSRRFSACDRCFPTCWHSSGPEGCFSGGTYNYSACGAIQPAASRTMRSRAETAFDNMCANKINVAIIIIVVQPVCLYRRTPFMISSLHVTKVMMLNMIMTTRRGCGSLCNLYASAVGHLS